MKKSGNRENSGFAGSGERSVRSGHLGIFPIVCASVSVLCAITLFVLFFVSWTLPEKTVPIVLFYGVDNGHGAAPDNYFPYSSMRVALKGAGFDMDVVSPEEAKDPVSDTYAIPARFNGRDVVVCACYQEAFYVMEDIYGSESLNATVLGYALIAPYYPGNAAAADIGKDNPRADIAIFGKNDSKATVDSMSDPRMLFEKLSGVDTIFGAGIVRDNIFASEIHLSSDGTRYLSLSFSSAPMRLQMALPSFQTEFAGLLGTLYTGELPYASINAWHITLIVAIFLGIASLCMFLYNIPVQDSDKGAGILTRRDGLVFIIVGGISAFIALGIFVMALIPAVRPATGYLLCFAPTIMIAVMAVMNTPFILSNKIKFERKESSILNAVIVLVAEVGIFVAVFFIFSGIFDRHISTMGVVALITVFIVDASSIAMLGFVDRKSRFGGLGGGSYFGTVLYPVLLAAPGITAIVMGKITGSSQIVGAGIFSLLQVFVPYIATIPVKRNSDLFEIAGLLHGICAALPVVMMV